MFNLSRLQVSWFKNLQPAISVPMATIYTQPKFRNKANKHWNPKFRKFRALKVIKVHCPDFYKQKPLDELTPDEIRAKMKEKGLQPRREWQERTFDISCTGGVFEPYVPPEGDGKMSLISVGGAKQVATRLEKKSKSYLTVRKIRQFDEDFDYELFANDALKIYNDLHTEMARIPVDENTINTLVTERAFPEVVDNLKLKTLKWSFIESIEPARVVHGRQTYMVQKDNIFAQLTVRFHTKQVLAVYDRFGRLCHGNPLTAKDVLEYVVFEKHLSNEYGSWRIHHKIIPSWMHVPPQQRTIRIQPEETPSLPSKEAPNTIEASSPPPAIEGPSSSTPQLTTA